MAKFTTADDSSNGPRVADLVDRDVALFPLKWDVIETKEGKREALKVYVYDLTDELKDRGTTLLFQDVLREDLRGKTGWVVGRIVKPGRAYLLKPPGNRGRVAELMELVPDDPTAPRASATEDDPEDELLEEVLGDDPEEDLGE